MKRALEALAWFLLTWAIVDFATGCAPPRHPTPGGIVVEGELAPAKQRELDARHVDVLDCLQPYIEAGTCKPPAVRRVKISGECDSFVDGYGRRVAGGWHYWGPEVPPSLGAYAHEVSHGACGREHSPATQECGSGVDSKYRRLFPPQCEDNQ